MLFVPKPNPRRELTGVASALLRVPALFATTRRVEDPTPVLVVPGFKTSDRSTVVLRRYLRRRGHAVDGWGFGVNDGNVKRNVPRVISRIRELHARHGRPIALVGWSQGGVLAREAARELPELVTAIVTLGTPVVGGPKYTATAPYYEKNGVDLDAIEAEIAERNASPLPMPIRAIYSKTDSIVAWGACFDPNAENQVEHVEVQTSHMGLGFSPEALRAVAHALD